MSLSSYSESQQVVTSGLISFSIDIYNPDQFCSGRTIFVVIAGPAGPFMSNICGPAGPFMHPDQTFCYRMVGLNGIYWIIELDLV